MIVRQQWPWSTDVKVEYEKGEGELRVDIVDTPIHETAKNIRLRYKGAETLVMLQAEGWTGSTSDLQEVKNVWQNWRIPMAANLQLVFFRHPRKEEVLLQVLLNEEPVVLPIEPVTGHFYSWKAFETYYGNQL